MAFFSRSRRGARLEREDLVSQVLVQWDLNNEILIYLLDRIPRRGFSAIPAGSRGRDVAAQFAHLHRARVAWVSFHRTGKPVRPPRYDKTRPPSKAQLHTDLRASGREVRKFLSDAMETGLKTRLFNGQVVRWSGYLISHESHHRGSILLALRQSGVKLPGRVLIDGLWRRWYYGD